MLSLIRDWQHEINDTIPLTAGKILPPGYDPALLKRKPDKWQPDYTLKKYFAEVELN